jgi:hypothetical protein
MFEIKNVAGLLPGVDGKCENCDEVKSFRLSESNIRIHNEMG